MALSKRLFNIAKSPIGDLIIGIAFSKLSSIIPVIKIRDTDKVLAFWHPKPYWEKHILIVPKKQIKNMAALNGEDFEYIKEVFRVTTEIVNELKWIDSGYTILSNGGDRQEVNQLHFHLWSGKEVN